MQVGGLQVGRPLRLRQRAAEIEVDHGHVIRGGRRHFTDFVLHQPVHGLHRGIHALLLLLQAGLERLPQLHGHEFLVDLLREDQCRTPGERPGPRGPPRPGGRIDAHDFLQLLVIERHVVRRLVYLGDLEAGLEGRLDRPGKLVDVAPVRAQRAIPGIGLLIEVSRDEQRLPSQGLIHGLGCDPLVFLGGPRQLAALPVGVGDLSGGLEQQFVLRVRAAKRFEHARRRRPVLQPDQCGAGVVFCRRTDAGGRRFRANPQEVVRRRAIIPGGIRDLTLLVDRGGKIVDERGARLVALRRDRQHLGVGLFGLRVLGDLE